MDRRNFLKATSTLIAGASLHTTLHGQEETGVRGRMVLAMNRGWLYARHVPDGGHERAFVNTGFERVVIPHTNIRLPWHSFDEREYGFVSLYRRHSSCRRLQKVTTSSLILKE